VGASEFTSVNPRLMQTILRHMEGLRRSIEGDELYALIARTLRKHGRPGPIGMACFTELYHQLDAYAHDPVSLATTRIKARLLQQHILPCLPEENSIVTAVAPAPIRLMATDILFRTIPRAQPANDAPPPAVTETTVEPATQGVLESPAAATDDRRDQYETLRRSEQDAWRAIYDAVKDFGSLKKLWASKIDEISQERDQFERKLIETEQHLKTVEASRAGLCVELETARRAPRKPTRRLTRLSRLAAPRLTTRDAFLQQVQAEISRVKRSEGSAALALLGIDDLRAIEQQHGTGTTTAVLDCYAREILSSFRAYDIVGRYDEDAFAVLFPDTHQDGAVRALEKAQKRAGETHVRHDRQRFTLPGFYGVLTIYSPGEEALHWLQRTEASLASARAQDRERLIVA